MRTFGRIPVYLPGTRIQPIDPETGLPQTRWVEVDTDALGFNDFVYLTALAQVLKLNLGESPFWANFGIPAKNSVLQQIPPDFYIARTQQQFSPRFAALIVAKIDDPNEPSYRINATLHSGVKVDASVPVPT